jgi:tetratricopeptide (TPR) repeat protein
VASPTLTAILFLFAVLSSWQAAIAQNKPQTPPPVKLADNAEQIDPAELQQQRFLHGVAQAVIRLDADGDRTMDAIENSQVTLTFDTMQDSSRLAVLCNNGGKTLNAFAQSLAGELQLIGKVNEAACFGSGRDDNPFVMKFRLHYESGRSSLFYEQPPELPFIVEKPVEDELEGNTPIIDRAESSTGSYEDRLQDMPSEPSPEPTILNPRRSQSSHATMQLPQGWTPVKLPAAIHADSAFGTFDSSVNFADGTLTLERKLVLKRDKVEVAELPAFQEWTETIERGATIALRSTLYYPDRDASAGTEEQKRAANLVDEAFRDIQAHELAKAEAALNQAEAIDPGHEILHENRGELAAARGDNFGALAEYRKELESFPNALFEMSSIAQAQLKLGDTDAAIVTLQRWMLADPNSPIAAMELMVQYHSMGRDDLAVGVGDDAMNTMTRDAKRSVDFLMTYGREQMLTGQPGNSKRTLEALLDLTMDPEIVFRAAYYLAAQGISLDLAEQSVREALTEFDPTNPARAISTSYSDSFIERTGLLLGMWDTLGWVLYKKGAVQEAESYARAAWRNRQDIAACRELGEILTAEEKSVEAMDVYTIGLAAFESDNPGGMAKAPDAIAARDALAQLKQEGNISTVTDPKEALLALRTLDLGPVAKPQGPRPYAVTMTVSGLSGYPADGDAAEEPVTVADRKLLLDFFPPDSNVKLIRKGTIQCSKTCSLVFTP